MKLKICSHRGCNALVEVNKIYCPRHYVSGTKWNKKGKYRVPYSKGWNQLAKEHIAIFPFCQNENCTERAIEVHHIVSIAEGGTDDRDNIKGLCRACHTRATQEAINKKKGKVKVGVDGTIERGHVV